VFRIIHFVAVNPRSDSFHGRLYKGNWVESGTVLQAMNRDARNKALRKLLDAGMSVRQIERLTGISRGIVQRAKT
jgi:transposase-like protein